MINAFITGISGTLGQAVTKILRERGDVKMTGYSRDEFKQSQLPMFKDMTLYLGDIRDQNRVVEATRNADIIFHFAALKRVDMLESNPEEAYKTNVFGTDNILHAQRANNVKRVVLSSTDKACYPINAYGCSKLFSEILVSRNPNNVVCRYGNVLASRGSVIPDFIKNIKAGEPVKITDKEMTRFFIRIEDAAKFVVDSAFGVTGGLKIPSMKATNICDMAKAIGLIYNKPVYFEEVGKRPGEKLAECLRMDHEGGSVFSDTATRYTEEELAELILPLIEAE